MKTMQIAAAAVAAFAATSLLAEPAIELDFKKPESVVDAKVTANPDKPNEKASGKILRPMFDNSAWCDVTTEYAVLDDNGVAYQRVKVLNITPKGSDDKTSCGQVVCFLPAIDGSVKYQLQLKARSESNSEMKILIRERGGKYAHFWGEKLTLTPEWKDYKFDVEVSAPEKTSAAFYLQFPKPGTVDIATLKLEKK